MTDIIVIDSEESLSLLIAETLSRSFSVRFYNMNSMYLSGEGNAVNLWRTDSLHGLVTDDCVVVMGENTFFSIVNRIGKPLPNRENYVATLANDFNYPNVNVINDLISFLKTIKDVSEEYFIIGGKRIYELSLPYADRLYITHINREYEGNVYFPKINYSEYKKIKSNKIDELDFCVYERIKKEG